MAKDDTLERSLSHYRRWGVAAMCFFMISVALLLILAFVPGVPVKILYVALLCGFLWIGATSFSRHALVVLKQSMGRKLGIAEFLSTQFVALLFPLAYKRVRDEVKAFRKQQRAMDKA